MAKLNFSVVRDLSSANETVAWCVVDNTEGGRAVDRFVTREQARRRARELNQHVARDRARQAQPQESTAAEPKAEEG